MFAMSSTKFIRRSLQVLVLTPLVLAGLSLGAPKAHAAGGFSFLPIGGTYHVNDSITVSIYENSGTDPTNAVAVEFTYPADKLQYVGGDSSDSAFPVSAIDVGTNGMVTYNRGTATPVTGNQLIERAVFRVVGTGTVVLQFKSGTVAVSSEDNQTNVAPDRGSASFTLLSADSTTPPPSQPPAQPPASSGGSSSPTPSGSGSGSTTTRSSTPTTRVTPVNSDGSTGQDSIPLGDQSVVELDNPVDVQPATIQPDGISKVEYYLDGKLVKTVTVAPYMYRLQTTELLNGKYKLTTKTYYTNGQTQTTTQTLLVNNPFSWTQFRLLVQKYILLIIFLIFIVIAAVVAVILRRNMGQGTGGSGYDELDDTYISPPPSTTITPTMPGPGQPTF